MLFAKHLSIPASPGKIPYCVFLGESGCTVLYEFHFKIPTSRGTVGVRSLHVRALNIPRRFFMVTLILRTVLQYSNVQYLKESLARLVVHYLMLHRTTIEYLK